MTIADQVRSDINRLFQSEEKAMSKRTHLTRFEAAEIIADCFRNMLTDYEAHQADGLKTALQNSADTQDMIDAFDPYGFNPDEAADFIIDALVRD